MRRRKGFAIAGFILMATFGLSAAVMLLWNAVLVPSLQVGPLSYWQAMGLLVLSKILFGGFRGRPRGGGPPWTRRSRHKWSQMSAEDRARFKSEWKKRCAPESASKTEE